MKQKGIWTVVIVLLVVGLLAGSCAPATPTTETEAPTTSVPTMNLDLAHDFAVSFPSNTLSEMYAERVFERTNGRVKITVHPTGTLFKLREIPDAISTGALDMGIIQVFAEGLPTIGSIGDIPGQFSSAEHLKRAYDAGVWDIFTQAFEEAYGFKEMHYHSVLRTMVFSSSIRLIIKPEDTEGQKVRTYGTVLPMFLEDCGAIPVVLSGSEAYMAMQTGVVDANLSNLSSYVDRKWYEVQKYFSPGELCVSTHHLAINRDLWESLPSDIQQIMWDTSEEVYAEESFPFVKSVEEEKLQILEEECKNRGGEIHILSASEIDAFNAYGKRPLEEWLKENPRAAEVLEIINETR